MRAVCEEMDRDHTERNHQGPENQLVVPTVAQSTNGSAYRFARLAGNQVVLAKPDVDSDCNLAHVIHTIDHGWDAGAKIFRNNSPLSRYAQDLRVICN
jgi:hypothetical protein